jgi:hypothetical protein
MESKRQGIPVEAISMRKGRADSDHSTLADYHRLHDETGDPSGNKTLADLGITQQQSSDWQWLADLEPEFSSSSV